MPLVQMLIAMRCGGDKDEGRKMSARSRGKEHCKLQVYTAPPSRPSKSVVASLLVSVIGKEGRT